jgi:hypothetical protein
MKGKNPFTRDRFEVALDRFPRYVSHLKEHGTNWIGLRFCLSILWSPLEGDEDEDDF